MNNTPETDELIRSLTYEQLASTESCYAQMREHARNLERDRNEQCRLLGMSAERECDLRGKLDAERALADRLAEVLRELCETLLADKPRDITEFLNKAGDALTAWKEARSE